MITRPLAHGGLLLAVALVAVGATGCGTSPTTPGTQTPPTMQPPPPPPPSVPNTPPTITSLTVSSPRVEADEDVAVTAVVEDADTPVDKLTYEWSAAPANGSFVGQGRQVRWVAPHLQPTPDLYTLTLTVIENYTDATTGEAKQFKVAKTVQAHYNDSYRDVSKISMRFLTELFPTYTVTPQQAVQDFSDNCPGKAEERAEIEVNRRLFRIESGSFAIASIAFDSGKTSGTITGACLFKDTVIATGVREMVAGRCVLDTVYENWKWLLCNSTFQPTGTTTSPFALQGRVPARIISPP